MTADKIGLPEAMKQFPNLIPIIHLSAHGDGNGLALADGSHIDWHELKALLQPVNKALAGSLILCLSCCKGYSGIRMAMAEASEDYPFFALVGSLRSPTWADTLVAFSTFYHLLNKGFIVLDAVAAMNVAAGAGEFVAERAEESRQGYLDFCSQKKLEQARTDLEQVVDAEPKPELSKFASSGRVQSMCNRC